MRNLKRLAGTIPIEPIESFHALSIECDWQGLALIQRRRSKPFNLDVLPTGFWCAVIKPDAQIR
jgi:hypothetical protein